MSDPEKDQVNEVLRGSYTADGIAAWWHRPRVFLGGSTPQEMWDQGRHKAVVELAQELQP